MTSATLFRLSGLSLLLSGLLVIALTIVELGNPQVVDPQAHDPLTVPVYLVAAAAVLLELLGLPGLYARQAPRAGLAGLVGTVLLFFSIAILDGTHDVINVGVWPAVGADPVTAPLLAAGEQAVQRGPLGVLIPLGGLLLLLGFLALGGATLRAGVLPRWVGLVLVIAGPLPFVAFVVPAVGTLAFNVPYLALACAGFVLFAGDAAWSRRAVPVAPVS
jgi:hypothetical protein